jgi:hypothetical protein
MIPSGYKQTVQHGIALPQLAHYDIILFSIIFCWLFPIVTKFFIFDFIENATPQKKHLGEFSNGLLSSGSFDRPYLLTYVII